MQGYNDKTLSLNQERTLTSQKVFQRLVFLAFRNIRNKIYAVQKPPVYHSLLKEHKSPKNTPKKYLFAHLGCPGCVRIHESHSEYEWSL